MRLIYTLVFALAFTLANPVAAVGVVPAKDGQTEAAVAAAKAEHRAMLKAMTPAERKAYKRNQRRELKAAVKDYKQAVKAGEAPSTNTLLLVILAILLPPVAVLVHQGELNSKFWIALILTLLFYLPGLIYALLVIFGETKKK